MGKSKKISFFELKNKKCIGVKEGGQILLAFIWKKKHFYRVIFNQPRAERLPHSPHQLVYPYAIHQLDETGKILKASGGTTPHYPDIIKHLETNPHQAARNFQKTLNWEVL